MHIYIIEHNNCAALNGAGIVSRFVVGGGDDRTGDNIALQQQYLEARCHYWVWKNAPDDFVGFQGRRRLFLFQPMIDSDHPMLASLSEQGNADPGRQVMDVSADVFLPYQVWLASRDKDLWERMSGYDVIAPRPLLMDMTLAEQFRRSHGEMEWEVFAYVAKREGLGDGRMHYLTAFHQFVMRWDLFDDYMQLWWRVMPKVYEMLPWAGGENRILGFMGERLFTMWLHRLRRERPATRILTLPVLFASGM
jgi:hypothetical protein